MTLDVRLERHRATMIKFARTLGVPEADVEDVVQDAALALWQAEGAYRGESAWLTYALAVVKTCAVDRYRRSVRRAKAEGRFADTCASAATPEDPILGLTDEERTWIQQYTDRTTPDSERTKRRKLSKVKRRLRTLSSSGRLTTRPSRK